MRELIIYIAYKGCLGYESFSNSRSWVFIRAKNLLASIIAFHFIQIVILLADKRHFPIKKLEIEVLAGFVVVFIASIILCNLMFTNKILSRAMAIYEYHWINKYARLIAIPYLLFVIFLTAILLYFRST